MPAPCVAYAGSLSFARLTLKTSVYHALLLPLFDRGHEATHNHTSPFGRGNVTPPTLPPLMVRGGVEQSETEGIRKSVFDKVNRNADINPQKGRHLLCTFCPCEKRKQGETSRRRERKETGSQPHGAPQVGVLYKSFLRLSYHFFREKMVRNRDVWGGGTK